MGDKIKHPSDCATCAPGSPALPHAASNAAAERAAAERERVAFLHAKCADIGEALASAIDERDEARADLDALARAVAQALMVPTLTDREELVDPSDHAIVGAMLRMRNARDTALARRDEARAKLAEVARECDEARSTLDAMSVSLRDRLAEAERERDEARAAYYEARTGWRVSERLRGQAEGEVARLRCFAEGLAQGLSVPAAGASSGLCRVCLTARPPLAQVATVTTRGASGDVLHFCDECWGLTAARHSGVAR